MACLGLICGCVLTRKAGLSISGPWGLELWAPGRGPDSALPGPGLSGTVGVQTSVRGTEVQEARSLSSTVGQTANSRNLWWKCYSSTAEPRAGEGARSPGQWLLPRAASRLAGACGLLGAPFTADWGSGCSRPLNDLWISLLPGLAPGVWRAALVRGHYSEPVSALLTPVTARGSVPAAARLGRGRPVPPLL